MIFNYKWGILCAMLFYYNMKNCTTHLNFLIFISNTAHGNVMTTTSAK